MKSKLRLRAVFALLSVQPGGLMISVGPRKILALMIALALAAVTTLPTYAQAITTTDRVIVPFEILLNACNFEEVILSGELLVISHTTTDAHGGLHVEVTSVLRHVSGVGAVTGTLYKSVGGDRFHVNFAADLIRSNFTMTHTSNLISKGGTDNRVVQFIFHGTSNAKGETTVVVERFSSECVG